MYMLQKETNKQTKNGQNETKGRWTDRQSARYTMISSDNKFAKYCKHQIKEKEITSPLRYSEICST